MVWFICTRQHTSDTSHIVSQVLALHSSRQWAYAQNRFRSRNASEARKTPDRLRFVIVVLDPVREIEEIATPWVRGDLYNTDKWVSAYDVHDTPRSMWSRITASARGAASPCSSQRPPPPSVPITGRYRSCRAESSRCASGFVAVVDRPLSPTPRLQPRIQTWRPTCAWSGQRGQMRPRP